MEDVRELKNVLERVEAKLMSAEKMYSAMNFSIWLSVMLGFYLLMGLTDFSTLGIAVYWVTAGIIAFVFSIKIWKRFTALLKASGARSKNFSYLTAIPWILGVIIGWIVIPKLNLGVHEMSSLAVGFLSFISISVFGMWLLFETHGAEEKEMIPAFAIPALGIPVVATMTISPMIWAGFLVAFAFSITILWSLYSAFRKIG